MATHPYLIRIHTPLQGRIALAGSNSIRIMDVSGTEYGEVKSDAIDLDPSLQIEKVEGLFLWRCHRNIISHNSLSL